MTARTTLIASVLLATGLVSGAAQAALLGRDLDGNFRPLRPTTTPSWTSPG